MKQKYHLFLASINSRAGVSDVTLKQIMIDCPAGFYCPNGTGYDWRACPQGTYSNQTGLGREEDCLPCDSGKVCRGSNLTSPNEVCGKGYYCVSGASSPNPYMTNLTHCPAHFAHVTVGGICPRGHFCKAGSSFYEGTVVLLKIAQPIYTEHF